MNFTAKAMGIGAIGAIIGIQSYMLINGVPKSYHKIERKMKKAAEDLSDLVVTVSDSMNSAIKQM